jgi:hypothetical protein
MHLRDRPVLAALTQTVNLPRFGGDDLSFQLQPLPLGFHRRLRERGIAPPTPPLRIARDSQGRPMRDDAGRAVTQSDPADPRFVSEMEAHHQRVAVLAVVESLAADPNVRFDAQPPAEGAGGEAWAAYADALHQELDAFGLTAGDLILLVDAIGRLSNLVGEHLRQARANFSAARTCDSP